MNEFVFAQPVRLYFGAGRLDTLSDILKELGVSKAVMVCDPFLRAKAEELRKKCPVIMDIFSDVEPNPQLRGAEAAALMARELQAEAIIGMGGGSTMDTAKFAAATALSELPIDVCYEQARFAEKRLLVIAIPSTAGTGSEVTQVSVMSRGEEKKTINNPVFMPAAAVVDPCLMLTVPPRQTMMTGLDALSHALEGFWSVNHQPICDLYAEEAIRLVLQNLREASGTVRIWRRVRTWLTPRSSQASPSDSPRPRAATLVPIRCHRIIICHTEKPALSRWTASCRSTQAPAWKRCFSAPGFPAVLWNSFHASAR